METQVAKPEGMVQNRFDREDRERIRDVLITYMEGRSIGVPTLQKEIAIANDIELDRIPLSTLQRFLSSTHRTNDAFVRFCHVFSGTLPASDAPARLASELRAFFAPAEADTIGGEEDAETTLPARLNGYTTDILLRKRTPDVIQTARAKIVKMGAERDSIIYSELERSDASRTSGVRERLFNWALAGDPPADPDVYRAYEGAAMISGGSAVIVLRNQLTRAPRTYVLTMNADRVLVGRSAEPVSAIGTARVSELIDSVLVKFVPIEAGA